MKTILKITKYIMLTLLLFTFSCISDDDNSPESTVSELLANKWFIEKFEDTSTTPVTTEMLPPCTQKSHYYFLNDGTYLYNIFYIDGDDNCVPFGILVKFYILNTNGKEILIQNEDGITEFTLTTHAISSTSLTLTDSRSPHLFVTYKR